MWLLARLRLLLARRPWLYWLAVGLCAASAWLTIHGSQARVEAERSSWGSTITVWVAEGSTEAGASIRAAPHEYPAAVVPPSAITEAPTGVARRSIAAGEILVEGDLAGDADPPTGWVVLAVAADLAPVLVPGDSVAVMGNGQRLCDGLVTAVATEAPSGDGIEIAVPANCAGVTTTHLTAATVVLARLP